MKIVLQILCGCYILCWKLAQTFYASNVNFQWFRLKLSFAISPQIVKQILSPNPLSACECWLCLCVAGFTSQLVSTRGRSTEQHVAARVTVACNMLQHVCLRSSLMRLLVMLVGSSVGRWSVGVCDVDLCCCCCCP